jgi:hypothetical protein
MLQTTLGIPVLILLLRLTTRLVAYTPLGKPPESIESGNYGRPPNAWWWLKQSFIYFCGLMGMKICVLVFFMMLPWISRVGDWALGWTEGNEQLQIVFVMMLFPLIMNALQYYIIDSFIKKKSDNDSEGGPTSVPGSGSGSAAYEHLSAADSDDDGDDDAKNGVNDNVRGAVNSGFRGRDYDPDVDGDDRTVMGNSASNGNSDKDKILPKSLYPHE